LQIYKSPSIHHVLYLEEGRVDETVETALQLAVLEEKNEEQEGQAQSKENQETAEKKTN